MEQVVNEVLALAFTQAVPIYAALGAEGSNALVSVIDEPLELVEPWNEGSQDSPFGLRGNLLGPIDPLGFGYFKFDGSHCDLPLAHWIHC